MDYSFRMLEELEKIENLSNEYPEELRFLSQRIRNDFWNKNNEEGLAKLLKTINNVYSMVFRYIDYFDLSCIIEYVKLLAKYCICLCPNLDADYYNQLIDDIQIENARVIIEKQWKNIMESQDGFRSFKEIFDDFFTQCMEVYKDKFFHELSDTDILCRVVNDKYKINKERFIPWDNTSTLNRWNPPGKTYLYLSFATKRKKYNSELDLSEYICLEEYRAEKGNRYYFCNFKPIKKGVILDLSYNDISLRKIKNYLLDYQDDLGAKMFQELMCDSSAMEKYKNRKKLIKAIKGVQRKYEVDKGIIEENLAKQYLKIVCSCIYKKVDETDVDKKEQAYKSFWTLARYLEEKGVTGIIYPCTRTKKIQGKNLVLFDKYDAEPIESSIREFYY